MQKIENLIQEPLKERLKEVTSKPKRRRIKGGIIASTEEHREQLCKELRHYEYKESQEQLVPVLFLWGKPQKRLTKTEAKVYKNMGSRIEYMKESELNILNI